MKAQLWKITVSDGFMGAIHGMFNEIIELYVPSLGFTCNLYGDNVNFFKTEDRYTRIVNGNNYFDTPPPVMIKEIEISDGIANRINSVLENREIASTLFSEFFKALPEYIDFENKKEESFKESQKAYQIGLQNRVSPTNLREQFETYVDKAVMDDLTFWQRTRERISGVIKAIFTPFS